MGELRNKIASEIRSSPFSEDEIAREIINFTAEHILAMPVKKLGYISTARQLEIIVDCQKSIVDWIND